ncbi:tRNA:m(4)X modification enzyme TRM13 homolog [Scleropages formosus]|uniref:tRNA:m(4)X modification enzyme TRM13 n=1 Tax=Scleropages formosus TaxID=113540 RepID=A0A8D0CBT9_SCLFO|nr:tRNA:m(4)X modification enzyme TRM13 homolog [Scleropages formosus]
MEELPADGVSAPLPGRCRFYVAKKKRFCKMIVGRGKTLCGEHADGGQEGERRRIPCPLDPKHTVFEDSLAKHLKKCNSREKPKPVYYVQDINAGPQENEEPLVNEVPIADHSKVQLDLLIQRLKKAVDGITSKYEERILSHPALNDALSDPKNGDSAFKHLKQQASLLGNMNTLGLLGADRCFIEFGAGKGKLSHWMHVAMQECHNVHFLLVERSSTRFKVDGKHRSADSIFERLQVDIQHLSLRRVPFLREKKLPIVGVGKHLCGAATDLALRCLLESSGKETSEGPDQPPKKRARQDCEAEAPPTALGTADVEWEPVVSGLAVALCCHHRCEWRHYVGKEFFQERGLGAVEFAAYQRMSSWATCGLRRANNSKGHYPEEETEECEKEEAIVPNSLEEGVSAEEREHVGRLCKVLIDYGRVHFLRRHGFTSHLHHYTSRDVSLENVLLTAVPTTAAS